MKKNFAEQIIDSMVDENGHCGERGLSLKQFKILAEHLEEGKTVNVGGAYNRTFTSTDFTGTIGRYNVKLNEYYHFNPRYTVVEINKWCEEVPDTSNSTWQHNANDRIELDLMLLNVSSFETYYGSKYVYTFSDQSNNVYVWFTSKAYIMQRCSEDSSRDQFAHPGDTVHVKATVKEHTEFRDVKQTVLTRCHVLGVDKYNRAA